MIFTSGDTGESVGYQTQRSLRLRASASPGLSRTPGAAGNRKLLTRRHRVKRGALGTLQVITSAGTTSIDRLYFDTSDRLCLDVLGTTRLVSTRVFRDPTAYLVDVGFVLDVANGTAAQRAKLIVDGVEISAYSTDSRASITNTDTNWNNTVVQYLGRDNSGNHFDGYMAEPVGVDGSTSSTYITTDPVTTQIVAVRPSATYGTNGFYLDFSDPASLTTLMLDRSGNGNNWTASNISLTAGATYDSMLDVPLGAGGQERGNYCTWNPLDARSTTVQDGNLRAALSATTAASVTGTQAMSTGKWYWEVTYEAAGGSSAAMVGIVNAATNGRVYTEAGTWYYFGNNGNKYVEGGVFTYGASFTTGAVVGVALDMDAGTLTMYKNGVSQGVMVTGLTGKTIFPAINNGGSVAEYLQANFGQRPFAYTPPAGFKALHTGNLPTPTGAALEPKKYFAATLYTGAGAARSVINAGGFQPDLVWTKSRSAVQNHRLTDSVRGATKSLISNGTDAEYTDATGLTAFNSDGFTLGALADMNTSGGSYVAWQWKKGATPGFDIVTYTGNGSARTIAHALGVTPAMYFVKTRNTAINSGWALWHKDFNTPSTDYLRLDSTLGGASSASVFGASPTSSVFSVGTDVAVNTNGNTYVAWLFSEIVGFSKISKYTGNGSTDGPYVNCGFKPGFILRKRFDASGYDWVIWDTARDTYNQSTNVLFPNSSTSESATNSYVDITSNGFKIRDAGAASNASGGTYIFAAFAEAPFKYANAR